MAKLLWGQVYYHDSFVGVLSQEPGDRSSFTYDPAYLQGNNLAIAFTLPLQSEPFICQVELPPFFDNLVAEGWLEEAQTRLLGKRITSRFELLLAFGQDCAGAVSVVDPSEEKLSQALMDVDDSKELALFTNRASLSGVQPKLTIVEKHGVFYPSKIGELSTHIAKFPSRDHDDLVTNEYLTTLAFKHLIPGDECVVMQLGSVANVSDSALIINRFDRQDGKRIHFEEFNQLLNHYSINKYDGAYKDMADFIRNTPGCVTTEIYRLYLRILAGILLGNTDMHFKNFAMLHTPSGLRLTPSYDQVAAALYNYKQLALAVCNATNLSLGNLKPSNIIGLGKEFGLKQDAIMMSIETLSKNLPAAKQAVLETKFGSQLIKQNIVDLMEKRWNGTFALIGKHS